MLTRTWTSYRLQRSVGVSDVRLLSTRRRSFRPRYTWQSWRRLVFSVYYHSLSRLEDFWTFSDAHLTVLSHRQAITLSHLHFVRKSVSPLLHGGGTLFVPRHERTGRERDRRPPSRRLGQLDDHGFLPLTPFFFFFLEKVRNSSSFFSTLWSGGVHSVCPGFWSCWFLMGQGWEVTSGIGSDRSWFIFSCYQVRILSSLVSLSSVRRYWVRMYHYLIQRVPLFQSSSVHSWTHRLSDLGPRRLFPRTGLDPTKDKNTYFKTFGASKQMDNRNRRKSDVITSIHHHLWQTGVSHFIDDLPRNFLFARLGIWSARRKQVILGGSFLHISQGTFRPSSTFIKFRFPTTKI